MSETTFFNPYLKQTASATALGDGRYWLKHEDDGVFPVGFVAATILVGVPANILHDTLPEGKSVKQLSYEVVATDPSGFEYTGWVLHLNENQKYETTIPETGRIARPVGHGAK